MRVVHVYKDVYPVRGGMENYMLALCARLRAAHAVDAVILATSKGRRTERVTIGDVPAVKAARIASAASTPLSLAMPLELRKLEPDIVHLHVPYPMGELSYLLAARGTPMVITYHSDVVRQRRLMRLYSPVMEALMRRARVIMATSPQYKASSPWLRRYRARCRIVPLGVEQERFRRPDAATLVRAEELRALHGPNLLHFHGVFRYYKGIQYLIEAMPRLPEARLMISGSGPEEPALRARADALGVAGRVYFAGAVDDQELPAYYRAADVYVLPAIARSEAFGLSMVEAQASGVPCISTELGTGTSYVNMDGVTGLVVPPRDSEAIARAARRLLEDDDTRLAMGRRAQARAAELFDMDANAAAVAAIYRDVLDGTR